MKSFSMRAASFAMAAAMVLSVAAVSPVDAEAATAKITKKSSITAGKTYTYNVKNVTKSQYIKVRMSSGVTVKYNNKTVKKASTKIKGGKTIALKVKAADKVANYKATLKAVIYNKKTNKKVKTLTTQSTVKCTTLKVTDVQTASTTGKYLVATFNKALTSLNPADIEIRNLNTGELKGVEDVKLSSGGKQATITLVGNEDSHTGTGIVNNFVEANVDYSFSITQSGATATKNFTVDAIAAYVTVLDYDADTREITFSEPLRKNTNTAIFAGTVKLPETVNNENLQTLLGTTVNVWYNKNDVATKLVRNSETVIEGAFEYITRDTATHYFKDKVTGKQYYVSENIGNNSDVHNTYEIWPTANGYVNNAPNGGIVGAFDKKDYDYAKLVLYSNGKIRTIVDEENYTDKLYVTKVDADKNLVYCGDNKSVNLKGYIIISNDKKVDVKDIKVGDMVFVNSIDKFAEIYTQTKDGKVEAAYDKEFKFDGTLYKNDNVQVLPKDAKNPKKVEYKDAKAFVAAGGAATVYLDRAGQPVFIKGEQKYDATGTSATVLATADLQTYTVGLKNYVQIKGFDGSSVTTYAVDQDLLSKVTVYSRVANTTTINKTEYKKDSTHNFTLTSNKIQFAGDTIVSSGVQYKMIELGKDASGNVTEITIKHSFNPEENFVAGKSYVKEVVSSNGIQNYQITSGTPVYAYNTKAGTYVKVDYSQYSATTASGNTLVYTGSTGSTKDVAYVVVENEAIAPTTYVDAVVGTILTADGKASSLTVYAGNNEYTYTAFRDDTVKKYIAERLVAGDYVRVGLASDGKTVTNTSLIGDKDDNMTSTKMDTTDNQRVTESTGEFKTTDGTYKVAANYTVVKKVKNLQGTDRYEKATLSDLGSLEKDDIIRIHFAQTTDGINTGYVDAIVIEY